MTGSLGERIESCTACVAVLGLGYVGLPLALAFAKTGFKVIGLDANRRKIATLRAGDSYISDVSAEAVRAAHATGAIRFTGDATELEPADAVIICVPTPLRKTRNPDLSYVVAAVEQVASHLHADELVVLESTTYPGTIDEVVRPILEKGGLRAGRDFYLAFSPERVDPGNTEWTTTDIPKVVGGVTPDSTRAAATLYRQIVTVVPVSSPKVAEMVKLLENTYRAVNIGLVNEFALMCRHLGVDVWEVIDAAKTKPFGFMPFYPGPGLGGHCIPIDPYYLSWKAREEGFESRFIELAGQINGSMPHRVIDRIVEALNSRSRAARGARVHLFGVAYKPNVGDIRESPAIDIVRLLQRRGATVSFSDPHAADLTEAGIDLAAVPDPAVFEAAIDCAVIVTNHAAFDYARIASSFPLVVDTRNALRGFTDSHIFRL